MLRVLILLAFANLQVSSLMNHSDEQTFDASNSKKFPMNNKELKICAKGESICIPANYSKFDLPNEDETTQVSVGIDIKDIPNINDHEFSVTLNAFFVVRSELQPTFFKALLLYFLAYGQFPDDV